MKYDVFISKNSADQALADSIASFLESAGLTVFESKKDLPDIGDADYARAIFNALEGSKNIIIICSLHENGSSSQWVYDEWSWFINEIRSKRRVGQIMTIRNGILVEHLEPQLRKYESFEYDSYKSRILPYFSIKAYQIKKGDEIALASVEHKANSHDSVDLGMTVEELRKDNKRITNFEEPGKTANQKSHFDILQNDKGEIMFIIEQKNGPAVDPLFILDSITKYAFLYRSHESTVFFSDLAREVNEAIRKVAEIQVVEIIDDDVVREYKAPVRVVKDVRALMDDPIPDDENALLK